MEMSATHYLLPKYIIKSLKTNISRFKNDVRRSLTWTQSAKERTVLSSHWSKKKYTWWHTSGCIFTHFLTGIIWPDDKWQRWTSIISLFQGKNHTFENFFCIHIPSLSTSEKHIKRFAVVSALRLSWAGILACLKLQHCHLLNLFYIVKWVDIVSMFCYQIFKQTPLQVFSLSTCRYQVH